MITAIPFKPNRFESAARYYLDGRPAYPSKLIRRVATHCHLTGASRVLDLGCGPGPLAMAFAEMAAEVVAVDPDQALLDAGREAARRSGRAVTFRLGSSYDLSADLGRFQLVTIGRAFHWMDRLATARRLDDLIEDGGAIALFSDDHPDVPDNAWRARYEAVMESYTDEDEHMKIRHSAGWLRNEAILLDSPFSDLELAASIERRQIATDRLIDRALTEPRSLPAKLGARQADFARDLRAALDPFAERGLISEVVKFTALIAQRP